MDHDIPRHTDPLSDVLALLKPRTFMVRGFDAGDQWSIHFPESGGIKCYALLSGWCWLSLEGAVDAVRLEAGDCVLLPRGRAFAIANDRTLTPVDALTVFPTASPGGVITLNGGGGCFGIGGYFAFAGDHAEMLLGVLPPIVHLRTEADKAALRWCLERMMQELRTPRAGGLLIGEHLAHLLLVQALRLHLADGSNGGVGWLFALADRQMAAAISAMHGEPARRWTLQALAEIAGMSRSSFAERFKETVGTSPLDYLTRWRMMVAGDRLMHSGESIALIAPALGYESESAFSTAFKRIMGASPRQYARGRAEGSAARAAAEPMRGDRLESVG